MKPLLDKPLDRLLPIAESQGGYLLASQAAEQGVPHHTLLRLAKTGQVERHHWGVYRISRWPSSNADAFWPTLLWARSRDPLAVLSHRTALLLHDISNINPDTLDIAINFGVRIRGKVPSTMVIHRRAIDDLSVETKDGLPVTTIEQTLLDLAVDGIATRIVLEVLENRVASISSHARDQIASVARLDRQTRHYFTRYAARENAPDA